MKTLLTIDGATFLLPETADATVLVKQLKNLQRVQDKTHYGPGESNDTRYSDELGYFRASVAKPEKASFSIMLVDDGDVVTAEQFQAKCDVEDAKQAERQRVMDVRAA